jgi:hypothetical protein
MLSKITIMDKAVLVANLDELLKDMHPSNEPVRTVALKAIDAVTSEKKAEYTIQMDRGESNFFFHWEPMDTIGAFTTIFEKIGMNLDGSVASGGGPDGEYISFKIAC